MNNCNRVLNQNGSNIMRPLYASNVCPNICRINSYGGYNIDYGLLAENAILHPTATETRQGMTAAKAIGLNLNNNFFPPGGTSIHDSEDLDRDDIINNEWGDDLCFFAPATNSKDCWKYYNAETGEICAPTSTALHLGGLGSTCSSAARDYGGFDDAITMDVRTWISHCEDIPQCVDEPITDCSRIASNEDCIKNFKYDANGLPTRCYISTNERCYDFITGEDDAPWCYDSPILDGQGQGRGRGH